jgi:hypothetical protein
VHVTGDDFDSVLAAPSRGFDVDLTNVIANRVRLVVHVLSLPSIQA